MALSNDPFPRAALFSRWVLEAEAAPATGVASPGAGGVWVESRELGRVGGPGDGTGAVSRVSGGALVGRLAVVVPDPLRGLLRVPLTGGEPMELRVAGDPAALAEGPYRAGLLPTGEAWVAVPGDGAVHLLDGDGTGGRVFRPEVPGFTEPPGPASPEAMLADGSLLVRPLRLHAPRPGEWLPRPHPVLRVDREGRLVDTLLAPPPAHLPELHLLIPGQGVVALESLLDEDPLLAIHPRGEAVALLHRTQGLGESVQGWIHVAIPGPEGVERTAFPVPGPALPGGRGEVERRARRYASDRGYSRPGEVAPFVEAVLEAVGAPPWISPVRSYALDSEGRHWVGAGESLEWRRGTPDGSIWVPIPFGRPVRRIIDARGDLVVAEVLGAEGRWVVAVFEGGGT